MPIYVVFINVNVCLSVLSPSPNSPLLLSPVPYIVPLLIKINVKAAPQLICVTNPGTIICVNVGLFIVSLRPN